MDGSRTRPEPLAVELRTISWIALLVMMPMVFYFTTEGTWNLGKQRVEARWSGRFFMAQAEAMTHGRFNVKREDIQSECFFGRGVRCYGYFGVTPSLLRLPVLGILGGLGSALTPLYLGVAVLLAYWGALRLLERSLVEYIGPEAPRAMRLGYAAVGALALGPGGTLLFLTRPAVYEEAAAWGVAFFLLTLDRVWAWYRSRDSRTLIFALVFAIASANARPTAVTGCGVLGVLVAVLWRFSGPHASKEEGTGGDPNPPVGPNRASRRVLALAVCLSLAPGLTAAGVFWLKFKTPMPDLRLNEQVPEFPHWSAILRANGDRTGGLMFTPTELVAYLRPDSVSMQRAWPWFDFRFPRERLLWVPPLPPGGAYVEPVASLTSTMPLPWTLNLIVVAWLGITAWKLATPPGRRLWLSRVPTLTLEQWIFAAGSMASAAALTVLTVTTVGITNRYLGDFFAISVVGVALGHRVIVPLLRRRPILSATAGLVAVLLVGWSVLVTLSLNTRLVFR